MKTTKQLGIWMDHSVAYLMEVTDGAITTKTLEAQSFRNESEDKLSSHESLLHHKEQNQLADYFKQLIEIIKQFDEVVLFGPTDAKKELFHQIRLNPLFDHIKIELNTEDKMTENQQLAFVKDYFHIAK